MPESPGVRVGFVGLGKMGLPMCRNIMAAGFPLSVFSRTMSKSVSLTEQGAHAASSLASLAASSDVIITCLDTLAASESVYLDQNGLAANATPGALLIDHSTISPELAMRIERVARDAGMGFLDAPVSGGPEGAASATLSIMVGGAASAVDRGLPVMRAYGKTIRHMGGAGSGTHAKLVNQLLTFAHAAAAAEAIALAQRVGLDLDALGDVLRASFGYSRMLDRTLARVQKGDYRAGATLSLYAKDLRLVRDVGEYHGMSLRVTGAAQSIIDEAIAVGLSASDVAALRLLYPELTPATSEKMQ